MTRSEIKNLLIAARNAQIRANAKIYKLFDYLKYEVGLDTEDILNNSAKNANNLAEEITCHVSYGECDLDELVDDIMNAIRRHQNENME